MRHINYKSDFDFIMKLKDPKAPEKTIPWPDCDWDAVFWTSNRANAYTASCIGGVCTNCRKDPDGGTHFIFNAHGMGKGTLKWEPHFRLPNGLYPDGFQDLFRKRELDCELVDGDGDSPANSEEEITMLVPYALLTAYDLARKAGYEGTIEDYEAALKDMPEVVKTSLAVQGLVADADFGRRQIAEALRDKGQDVSDSMAYGEMAESIRSLELRIKGEDGMVSHSWGGAPVADMLNLIRTNPREGFPYAVGVSTPLKTVNLVGASAYLTSDGDYLTEDIAGYEFSDENPVRWVIYYFADANYTIPLNIAWIDEAVAVGGKPQLPGGAPLCSSVRTYNTDEGYELTALTNINCTNLREISMGNVRKITITTNAFTNTAGIRKISFPDCEEIEGNYHFTDLMVQDVWLYMPKLKSMRCSFLFYYAYCTNVYLPKLETIAGILLEHCNGVEELSLPALQTLSGGSVANSCAALTEVSLPALQTLSGGTVANSCAALTEVSLPALQTLSGGTVASSCAALTEVSLPALQTLSGGTVANSCAALTELSLPALEEINVTGFHYVRIVGPYCPKVEKASMPKLRRVYCGMRDFGLLTNYLGLTLDLPSLEHWEVNDDVHRDAGIIITCEGTTVNLPKCKYFYGIAFGPNSKNTCLAFGAVDDGSITFTRDKTAPKRMTIAHGWKGTMDLRYASFDADTLRDLIANLGDNSDNPHSYALILGANLTKLTDEEKAMATAKNYTLS